MRVFHIITRLIVGGAQQNTLDSVLGLRRLPGLEVHLVSGPTDGPEGSLEPIARRVPEQFSIVPTLVRPVHPLHDLRALRTLTHILRSERPDIVHTHSGKAGLLGRIAARRAGVPVVIHTIHGPSFGPFQGRLANLSFLTAERLAARCTTHFVVVANAMTRQYLAAGIGAPDRYTRVFSGFDIAPFLAARPDPGLRARYGLGPEHIVVGKIARLVPLKGHDDLLGAAAVLFRDLPQLRILLVGDGPLRARLEAEIAARGLTKNFVFTGLVDPEQIPDLVGIMDFLVHLSRREGLPRALPQALAAGRPVIAYDCDGANEVCVNGRTGFLVPAGNLTALRERIRLMGSDPRLRAELGRHGRDLVRDSFTTERMVTDLHTLYLRLLEKRERSHGPSPFAARR
jgi:glycosyltransferase involved in cell wall biosynthesis